MLQALEAVKGKISKDYHATHKESYDIIYAIAPILCPSKKSFATLIARAGWKGEDEGGNCANFMKTYQYALLQEFNQYQQRLVPQTAPANMQTLAREKDPGGDEVRTVEGSFILGGQAGYTRNGKTNRNREFTGRRFILQIVYVYSCDSESKALPVLTAIADGWQ